MFACNGHYKIAILLKKTVEKKGMMLIVYNDKSNTSQYSNCLDDQLLRITYWYILLNYQ